MSSTLPSWRTKIVLLVEWVHPTTSNTKKSGDSNASNMNQLVTQSAVVFSFLKNYNKAISVLDYELEEAVTPFERSIESNVSLRYLI